MSEGNGISAKSPVYERIEVLFDTGSFIEIDKYLELFHLSPILILFVC